MSSLWSPFYSILDEPARFPHGHMSRRSRDSQSYSPNPYQDFFNSSSSLFGRPAIEVHEEGEKYVVEADVPGVKKGDLDVMVGDGGKSVTIEGKVFSRRGMRDPSMQDGMQGGSGATTKGRDGSTTQGEAGSNTQGGGGTTQDSSTGSKAVDRTNGSQVSDFKGYERGASHFKRTVWLPEPVDGNKVTAQLADGVLVVSIPKIVQHKESIRVTVD